MKNVLFVCFGNICRSPACEGIANYMYKDKANFDSAGTSNWNIDSFPDPRSVFVCQNHGIDIKNHKARQITSSDWMKYDLIVALDKEVLYTLDNYQPSNSKAKLVLFDEQKGGVADPWEGDQSDFNNMYDQIEKAMPEFLKAHNII